MKALLIDDDKLARVILKKLLAEIPSVELVNEFESPIDALKYLKNNTVDVIFLDVHMPQMSGFDFIDLLDNPPHVVLTTVDKNFALDAFSYSCIVDYLVKPIKEERLDKCIEKINVLSALNSSVKQEVLPKNSVEGNNYIYVNYNKRLTNIAFDDILYIKANGDYIDIFTKKKRYTIHSTLTKIQEKLTNTSFVKVHRSYIVNVQKILGIDGNSVIIEKNVIPISRTYKKQLLQNINLI